MPFVSRLLSQNSFSNHPALLPSPNAGAEVGRGGSSCSFLPEKPLLCMVAWVRLGNLPRCPAVATRAEGRGARQLPAPAINEPLSSAAASGGLSPPTLAPTVVL